MSLEIKPMHIKAACDFVKQYHRHNIPDSTEQDMIIPRESYDEVKRMIEEAMK